MFGGTDSGHHIYPITCFPVRQVGSDGKSGRIVNEHIHVAKRIAGRIEEGS
jgi:hypothetical protein